MGGELGRGRGGRAWGGRRVRVPGAERLGDFWLTLVMTGKGGKRGKRRGWDWFWG